MQRNAKLIFLLCVLVMSGRQSSVVAAAEKEAGEKPSHEETVSTGKEVADASMELKLQGGRALAWGSSVAQLQAIGIPALEKGQKPQRGAPGYRINARSSSADVQRVTLFASAEWQGKLLRRATLRFYQDQLFSYALFFPAKDVDALAIALEKKLGKAKTPSRQTQDTTSPPASRSQLWDTDDFRIVLKQGAGPKRKKKNPRVTRGRLQVVYKPLHTQSVHSRRTDTPNGQLGEHQGDGVEKESRPSTVEPARTGQEVAGKGKKKDDAEFSIQLRLKGGHQLAWGSSVAQLQAAGIPALEKGPPPQPGKPASHIDSQSPAGAQHLTLDKSVEWQGKLRHTTLRFYQDQLFSYVLLFPATDVEALTAALEKKFGKAKTPRITRSTENKVFIQASDPRSRLWNTADLRIVLKQDASPKRKNANRDAPKGRLQVVYKPLHKKFVQSWQTGKPKGLIAQGKGGAAAFFPWETTLADFQSLYRTEIGRQLDEKCPPRALTNVQCRSLRTGTPFGLQKRVVQVYFSQGKLFHYELPILSFEYSAIRTVLEQQLGPPTKAQAPPADAVLAKTAPKGHVWRFDDTQVQLLEPRPESSPPRIADRMGHILVHYLPLTEQGKNAPAKTDPKADGPPQQASQQQ